MPATKYLLVFGFLLLNIYEGFTYSTRHKRDSNLLPDRENCGKQFADRIVGGVATEFTEFPWLVLLAYKKPSHLANFQCGGSVINNRYVLTAGHCVAGDILKNNQKLVAVRLGEWNTDTVQDCVEIKGFTDCNDAHLDVGIEESFPHPDYLTTGYHDIALIRMDRELEFTDFIQPICLPLPEEQPSPGDETWVSGWGRTEFANFSPVKLKVNLPIVSNQDCSSTFQLARKIIKDTQICAGAVRGKDSCNGDSGGPLMQKSVRDLEQWVVQGVVSFGRQQCGTERWPGVYTRVSKYITWIENNIRA